MKFPEILHKRPSKARTVLRKQLLVRPKPIENPISTCLIKSPIQLSVCAKASPSCNLAMQYWQQNESVDRQLKFHPLSASLLVGITRRNRSLSDRRMRMNLLTCTSPPSMGKPLPSAWVNGQNCIEKSATAKLCT